MALMQAPKSRAPSLRGACDEGSRAEFFSKIQTVKAFIGFSQCGEQAGRFPVE